MFNLLDSLSKFSELPLNVIKWEIAGVGVLKNFNVPLWYEKYWPDQRNHENVGVRIFYNTKLQDDLNFCDSIKNIANVIRLWWMRKLILEGKITIFKSLAISKIVYLALLTTILNSVIEELKQIQKMLLRWNKKPKIKHYITNQMLCNKCKDGGLKNTDIVHIVVRSKYSWIKRLCNENFHEWKLIPLQT